jgi:hypothetical protein
MVDEQHRRAAGRLVLVLCLFDSALAELLENLGADNTTQSGTPLTLPFGLALIGDSNGSPIAGSPEVDVLYYAREGVLGVGVPPSLPSAAGELLDSVR